MTRQPVAVVGAGPVGMVAALLLARRGVSVAVFEAGSELSSESRASTFHPPTLELLAELGVADQLIEAGVVARHVQFRERRGGIVARFDMGVLAGDTRYPWRIQCEQSKLTRIILDRLADEPDAEVRFDARVTGVDLDSDPGSAMVVLETPSGAERFRASYVIGADGASSSVRRSLGIAFPGEMYPERYLVVSTTFDFAEALEGLDSVNYLLDPSEWVTLLRTPQHWRAMFPVSMDADDAELTDPQAVQRRLAGVHPSPDPYPVLHCSIYRVHQRVATTFRHGRVLLAGDAAHINNPLGGLGMNSGIHDAWLAGGALGHVWHGEGDDAELDDYARRRREVCVSFVAKESERNWRRIRETDPEARREEIAAIGRMAADPVLARDYLMAACMFGTRPDGKRAS